MTSHSLSASDGLVIAMLAMMVLSLGVLVVLVVCMRRNVARRDRQVDDLLEEIAENEKRSQSATATGEKAPPAEPWERDGDWWKQ